MTAPVPATPAGPGEPPGVDLAAALERLAALTREPEERSLLRLAAALLAGCRDACRPASPDRHAAAGQMAALRLRERALAGACFRLSRDLDTLAGRCEQARRCPGCGAFRGVPHADDCRLPAQLHTARATLRQAARLIGEAPPAG